MKPKYHIGQKVTVRVYGKNWDDDYNTSATIISFQHSLVSHTYKLVVKTDNGDVFELPEDGVVK